VRVIADLPSDRFFVGFSQEAVNFLKSYVTPDGYPTSVAPAYTPYMQWRAVQVTCKDV
jgi:hypothetical protein